MPDEIKKAVEGDLTEEQLKEVEAKLSDEGKKQMRELLAIKAQRKAEETRLNAAKAANQAEEDRKKKEKEDAEKAAAASRTTTISQAKAKFFEEYQIPEADRALYTDAEFAKFDSGSTDVEVIKKDFLKIYGSLNAESLAAAKKKADADRIEREKQAAIDAAGGAGSHPNNPNNPTPPKYTPEMEKMAKESNITLDAAKKIVEEGRSRLIGA